MYTVWVLAPDCDRMGCHALPAYCGSTSSASQGLRERLLGKQAKTPKGAINLASQAAAIRFPEIAVHGRARIGVMFLACDRAPTALALEAAFLRRLDFAGNQASNGAGRRGDEEHCKRVLGALAARLLHPAAPGGVAWPVTEAPELPGPGRLAMELRAEITSMAEELGRLGARLG